MDLRFQGGKVCEWHQSPSPPGGGQGTFSFILLAPRANGARRSKRRDSQRRKAGCGEEQKSALPARLERARAEDQQRHRQRDSQQAAQRRTVANAERLPFPDQSFDAVTIAFGLRNVTDKQGALCDMRRVLKPGGQLLVLEFSKPVAPGLAPVYDAYSFKVLPKLGQWVANDAASYQYLAESIRMHPDQETLLGMFQQAGLDGCRYHNLTGGIVALHRGWRY